MNRPRSSILEDREALLKADALLALGRKKAAKRAYQDAIAKAQVESVALKAARGLVDVLGKLKDYKRQLAYVDALLTVKNIARRSNLLYQRAEILQKLGRHPEAVNQAWRLLLEHPTASAATRAERMLKRYRRQGVKLPVTSTRLELTRIRNLIRARAYRRAEAALKALKGKVPKSKLLLKRAQLYERQRKRAQERRLLEKIVTEKLAAKDEVKVLFRLGRLAMTMDDNAQAIAHFDTLTKRYPKTKKAAEGRFFAAWIHYDQTQYATASERMLTFADDHVGHSKHADALWYAGWSSYLHDDLTTAQAAWTRLAIEHPRSPLFVHARYWLGKVYERQTQPSEAIAEYEHAVRTAPLSYYGFMARLRLNALGTPEALPPPTDVAPHASLPQVIRRLGKQRPINLDRAVLLFSLDMQDETFDELEEASQFLRKVADRKGRTMIADLLAQLGSHYRAFRLGVQLAMQNPRPDVEAPWQWRAWRHAYPRAFSRAVSAAAKKHEVDPDLVWSVMRTESHYRPYVRSGAGARGLMQLMPSTARQIGAQAPGGRAYAARYSDADANVWLGGWYLMRLLNKYSGQVAAAVGAYNAGPTAMDRWLSEFGGRPLDEFVERVPYRETRRYIRRVLETYFVYRYLYGSPPPILSAQVVAPLDPEAGVRF